MECYVIIHTGHHEGIYNGPEVYGVETEPLEDCIEHFKNKYNLDGYTKIEDIGFKIEHDDPICIEHKHKGEQIEIYIKNIRL